MICICLWSEWLVVIKHLDAVVWPTYLALSSSFDAAIVAHSPEDVSLLIKGGNPMEGKEVGGAKT